MPSTRLNVQTDPDMSIESSLRFRAAALTVVSATLLFLMFSAAGCVVEDPAASPQVKSPYRILAYVGGRTDIWTIDVEKLTHINYAFAHVNEEGEIYFRSERAGQNVAQLQALKARNPNLKLLVSVGGWGADGFSDAALTDSSRAKFAASGVDMVKRYGLDGIDLDWEFPGQPGPGIVYRPEDEQNFTLMLAECRRQLDALSDERGRTGDDRYLLTIASNDDQEYFDYTEMDKLHVYLDFVNIMSYDAFTSGSPTTGHHSGLYKSAHPDAPTRTTESAVQLHLDAGIPADKIVIGTAFYGRGWTGVNPERNGLHQPYVRFTEFYPYHRLQADYIDKRGFVRHWDDAAKAPFLWNPDSTTFISYDDPESIRHETAFVKEQGLGGVMYWEHSLDPTQELLDTIYQGLK